MSDFSKQPGSPPISTKPRVSSVEKPRDDESTPAPRSQQSIDNALDEAIDSKTAAMRKVVDKDRPLKRQFDEDIEAELNEFLDAFDTKTLEAVLPAPKGAPRPKAAVVAVNATGSDEGSKPVQKGKTGKIVKITKDWVFLEMGGKSEGCIPIQQFEGKEIQVGDEIPITIERFDVSEGLLIVSLRGAAINAAWDTIKTGQVVEAVVEKTNKGGLEVTINQLRGFMPVSQIELGRVEDTTVYLGQKFKVMVTEVNARIKNLVVSRRDYLEQEREQMREKTLAELAEGQTREGVVRNIRDFGAFVDLGGVDGLLHIGDLSWSRVQKVDDIVKLGDHVSVKVLKMDPDKKRISLGLKQLVKSPWEKIADEFKIGSIVAGKVVRITDFGAFVELADGVEGLLHVSELSPNRVRRISDIVKTGQDVEVQILSIDPDQQRVSLSMKAVIVAREEEALDAADAALALEPAKAKPERKVPLKGGLGDGSQNLFKLN
ncbi:MAG: S1 RNA-binding domain-containing protein [Planctomycetota bacterium]|nr:S1 RNA-binding domain-containing protein [Planctomycetota bacterium]